MPPKKSIHKLSIGSPRMSRLKGNPISTAGSRLPQAHRNSEFKTQDTASYLDVVSLGINHENNSLRPIRLENTYKLNPDTTFRSHEVQKKAEEILAEHLYDKEYDSQQCKILSQTLSAKILEAIKTLGFKRYKMVAVVSIGSMKERPGMQLGSRCLWNKETDNFVSARYSNTSIFAVAMVYGLFYD